MALIQVSDLVKLPKLGRPERENDWVKERGKLAVGECF